MPRSTESTPLTTRAARERLTDRHQPYWREVDAGAALGYRKGKTAGMWVARIADCTAGGGYRQAVLGRADDSLNANGRDVLNYRQAEAKAREWIARRQRVAAGLEAEPEKPSAPYTVANAIADYMADYDARGGKGVPQTRRAVDAHILPAMGTIVVSSLPRERVKSWHRALAAAPARIRAKKGAAPKLREAAADADALRARRATANRILTMLKAALNHARAEGKVTCADDPWASVRPFREADKAKVRYLLDDEITRLVNACPPDFRAIVTAALLTGCRYGELTALVAGDLDVQAGTLRIGRSKSGKARHAVLTDEGRAFFETAAAGKSGTSPLFTRELLIRQATKENSAEYVRGIWGASQQFRFLRAACEAARISPAISFHILRHSYASRLAMRGAPMAVIAAQLGHTDTRMTERHYAHMAPSYIADTIRQSFGALGIGHAGGGAKVATLRVGRT